MGKPKHLFNFISRLLLTLDPWSNFLSSSLFSWTTKISLPLRTESHQTRNLFHDVHPSLLLFLHRLRSITIYNQVSQQQALAHVCFCT